MKYGKLWLSFAFVVVASFLVLGYYGREIYRLAPPIPDEVVTDSGEVLFTGQDIRDGQNVWQSMGGTASRQRLGAWRLCRSGLVGRLAAPRTRLAPRSLGDGGTRVPLGGT